MQSSWLGWFKKGSSPNPFLLFVYFLTFMSRGYYRLENPHWVMSGKEKERGLLTSLKIPGMQKFLWARHFYGGLLSKPHSLCAGEVGWKLFGSTNEFLPFYNIQASGQPTSKYQMIRLDILLKSKGDREEEEEGRNLCLPSPSPPPPLTRCATM